MMRGRRLLLGGNKMKRIFTDTLSMEEEIDIMVYKLYDLTYDEVLMVDKDFEMSKEEYEGIDVNK